MSAGLRVAVRGVGLLGPGLADWSAGRALLAEPVGWSATPTVLAPPGLLPPAERRRAGAVVKLSLAVGEQACLAAGVDARTLATVFAASSGDGANCHALCEALAAPERLVSPTRFTNSVHNAPAGYWHIATASRAPSTSLCAHDASFAAGLLEAAVQAHALARPVLLVAADVPYPQPLQGVRPVSDAFGLALVLDAAPAADALAWLELELGTVGEAQATPCDAAALDALRVGVPAARALPLLQALARGTHDARLQLADLDGPPLRLRLLRPAVAAA